MLVGEHGRVIPFHHFKTLVVGVGVVLILSLCALILLGVLYTRQRGQVGHLQKNLEELRLQSTKLRDEKDLYLTQLIALKKQTGALPQKATDAPQVRAEGGPPAADAEAPPVTEKAAPEPEEAQKEIPARKAEPRVKWSADIRNFKVSYDNRQGALTAEFRIYNTSRPKKRLRGRTVVVFKAIGDPPSNWAIVPAVPMNKETPVGKKGRSFKIRNYQTERFKTIRRMNSPKYDIAAVYIFTDQDGELIGNKELPFNVDYSPPAPPKPKPVVAPSEPEPEKPIVPPRTPPEESASPEQRTPGDSTVPDAAPNGGEPPSTQKSPDSPAGPTSPETPTSHEQPKVQLDTDGGGASAPEASEAIPPMPAAEPKPPQEGETQ